MSTHRAGRDDIILKVVAALIFLAIAAGVLGIRLAITGGDVGCAFSSGPALCVAVKVSDR